MYYDDDNREAEDYFRFGEPPQATVEDAIREWAYNVGAERPDQAWLCSNYDTWARNPHYVGPPQRHPEDDGEDGEAPFLEEGEGHAPRWPLGSIRNEPAALDELPF